MSESENQKVSDLQDLQIYQEAMGIGDSVWKLVDEFSKFAQNTIGYQFTRAADSIAANIAEGYGRFHYKENRTFCYYSRGSLRESECWLTKSVKRGLIEREAGKELFGRMVTLRKRLNAYIKTIDKSIQAS